MGEEAVRRWVVPAWNAWNALGILGMFDSYIEYGHKDAHKVSSPPTFLEIEAGDRIETLLQCRIEHVREHLCRVNSSSAASCL